MTMGGGTATIVCYRSCCVSLFSSVSIPLHRQATFALAHATEIAFVFFHLASEIIAGQFPGN